MATAKERRIVHFAKTRVRAQLLAPVHAELLSRGIPSVLYAQRHKGQSVQAADWLAEQGLPFREIRTRIGHVRRDDVTVTCGRLDGIVTLKRFWPANRIVVVALNEGCRFAKPGKYDAADVFLGYGPSARTMPVPEVFEVGSTEIESLMARRRTDRRMQAVVINLKGKLEADADGPNNRWLEEAVSAVRGAGMEPLISVHPNHELRKGGRPDLEVASEPIGDLMLDCAGVITRASTLIHQGVAIGCQPFFFTETREDAFEFAEPLGSYPIVRPGELSGILDDWQAGRVQYEPRPFHEAHVSVDPARSSVQRIADALEEIRSR